MTAPPPQKQQAQQTQSPATQLSFAVKELLESIYKDGIDAILTFDIDDRSNMAGKFRDDRQIYDFSITADGKVSYVEAEANGIRGDAYLAGYYLPLPGTRQYEQSYLAQFLARSDARNRERNCKQGKPCGDTCIAKGIRCNAQLSAQFKQVLSKVQQAAIAGKKGDWKKAAALLAVVGVAAVGAVVLSSQKSGSQPEATRSQPPKSPKQPPVKEMTAFERMEAEKARIAEIAQDLQPYTARPETNNADTWKPSMTAEEAEEWAKDSVYQELTYHGTEAVGAQAIAQEGFDISRTANAKMYGDAVYLASWEQEAERYANMAARKRMLRYGLETSEGEGEVMKIKVNIKNPLDMKAVIEKAKEDPEKAKLISGQVDEFASVAAAMGELDYFKARLHQGAIYRGDIIREIAQNRGHDSMITNFRPGESYIMVYDAKNVAVIK